MLKNDEAARLIKRLIKALTRSKQMAWSRIKLIKDRSSARPANMRLSNGLDQVDQVKIKPPLACLITLPSKRVIKQGVIKRSGPIDRRLTLPTGRAQRRRDSKCAIRPLFQTLEWGPRSLAACNVTFFGAFT